MTERARTATGAVAAPERPAVGIVATETNGDAVARAVLRAGAAGYDVFVAEVDESASGAQLARDIGVETISIDAEDHSMVAAREGLAAVAEQQSYPGLIFAGTAEERVDFDRSRTDLDESAYSVEATSVEEVTTTGTMAAIPAYNEAGTIADVVSAVTAYADEVVVVDDGSSDDTVARAGEAGARVVEHDRNRGYGAALQTAFETATAAGADRLVILDGDGQHDPTDIPDLLARLDDGADIAIGSRFVGDATADIPLYRRFGLGVVNVLMNLTMGAVKDTQRVHDTQSGFRAYDRTAIESLAAADGLGDHMDASLDILYHARGEGFDTCEVPTEIDYDVEDGSSHNPFAHGLMLVATILRTVEQDHPILSLGVPGVFSILAGVGLAYLVFSNFLSTGTFPGGMALASMLFVLAGALASFTGIILHSVNRQLSS